MSPRRAPRREVQPHLVELGDTLRRARETLRPPVAGAELARRLGWGQTKVSLIEAGRQTPTEQDVRVWAAATGTDADALLDMREAALTRRLDIRAAARRPGGADALQGDVAMLEAASTTIAEYQPTLIPGLAQTPAYTRAWLSQRDRVELGDPPDLEQIVTGRAARQQQAAGRRIVVAVQPYALTAVYGTVGVQVDQLDMLVERARAANFDLIVARGAVALLHGFELLDDAAIIETVAESRVMADPDVVAKFRAALDRIRRGGATGAAAVREVRRARAALTGQ